MADATTLPTLACSHCGGPYSVDAQGGRCERCGTGVPVDDLGIVRFGTADTGWRGVPSAFARAVGGASTATQVVDAMVEGEHALPARLQKRLLEPAGGAAAVLAPLRPGSTALDLGTGWSNLSSALGSLGATVVVADWSYPRLRFDRLVRQSQPELSVQVPVGRALPFADQSFDVVFADSAEIEHAMQSCGTGSSQSCTDVLREVNRVLQDGGTLVLGTSNPLRDRGGHQGSNAAGVAVRSVWSLLRPWDASSLSHAGFAPDRVVAAHPRRSEKHALVPLGRLGGYLAASRGTSAARRAAKQRLVGLGARAGAGRWMVRDYYVVAHRAPSAQPPPASVAHALTPLQGGPPPVVQMLSDARVAVMGASEFVKFPLSVAQQRALAAEVDKTQAARSGPLGEFVVPAPRVMTWEGVPYTVYPRIHHRTDVGPAEVTSALHRVLTQQDATSRTPLQATTLWRRMASTRGQQDIADLDAGALYAAVLACAGSVVPVGGTHGDLHADNLLLEAGGEIRLVDWNRFEAHNPLFLDPAYAAIRTHQRRTRGTLASSVSAFVDDQQPDVLAELADSLRGDLDRLHAALVVLLDRVVSYSEPRRQTKPWTLGPLSDAVVALTDRLG